MKTIKETNLSLNELINKIKELSKKDSCFIDEIPEVLQEDFRKFIVGHTISTVDGREITYDMKMYFDKVYLNEGISYPIKHIARSSPNQFNPTPEEVEAIKARNAQLPSDEQTCYKCGHLHIMCGWCDELLWDFSKSGNYEGLALGDIEEDGKIIPPHACCNMECCYL